MLTKTRLFGLGISSANMHSRNRGTSFTIRNALQCIEICNAGWCPGEAPSELVYTFVSPCLRGNSRMYGLMGINLVKTVRAPRH